jgi:positive regulator of sigma E activity
LAQYQGVVIGNIDELHCLVAIKQSVTGGCGDCVQKHQCQSSLSTYLSADESKHIVTCTTKTQHEIGDRVQVEVSSGDLVIAFLWVYLVPLLVLVLVSLVASQFCDDSVTVGVMALLSWLSVHGLQYYMAKHFDWVSAIEPNPYTVSSS